MYLKSPVWASSRGEEVIDELLKPLGVQGKWNRPPLFVESPSRDESPFSFILCCCCWCIIRVYSKDQRPNSKCFLGESSVSSEEYKVERRPGNKLYTESPGIVGSLFAVCLKILPLCQRISVIVLSAKA